MLNILIQNPYLERIKVSEPLAVQGVAFLMVVNKPLNSSDGVGSLQSTRLSSTHLIMASTFLKIKKLYQLKQIIKKHPVWLTCSFLVGRHRSASCLDSCVYDTKRTSRGRIVEHSGGVSLCSPPHTPHPPQIQTLKIFGY